MICSELDQARKDVENHKSELSKARTELDLLQKQSSTKDMENQISNFTGLLREKEVEIESLKAQLNLFEEDKANYANKASEHQVSVDAMRNELQSYQEKLSLAETRAQELEAELLESRKATEDAIALAEEAARETEAAKEELETFVNMRGDSEVVDEGMPQSKDVENSESARKKYSHDMEELAALGRNTPS